MAKTGVGQRIIAISIAILFLITSVGFSGLVIWEINQQNKKDKQTADIINNKQETIKPEQKKENSLEGTKLKDYVPLGKVEELQKIDILEGTGDEVQPGDTVNAHYTGAVAATGIIFQSSLDSGQPVDFSLAQVIAGWTEGVPGMKAGGKRRLIIPAAKAYGSNPPQGSNIPADADLVFDIELVKVVK